MIELIDSHCHLEKYFHAGALANILSLAKEQGVGRMIAVGTDFADWRLYHDLASKHKDQIYYSIGIHPCHVDNTWVSQSQVIAPFFAEEVKPIALGEIGLDYFHLPSDPKDREANIRLQKEAFKLQLTLALQFDVPVIIHSRSSFQDCVKLIDESGIDWKKVVFHCFVEGAEQVKILNERGGRASFTGIITYKNGEIVREAALAQGLDKIMIETDAPYLSPVPFRGKENRPAYVRKIAEFCADLFKIDLENFAKIATKNTEEFFGLIL